MKNEDDILGADIESVGSCSSLVNEEADEMAIEPDVSNIYSETHIGQCLNNVLNEMLEEGDIDIHQQLALRKTFNHVHYESFSQCPNTLHLDISGTLREYSMRENSSTFKVKNCMLSGPSSSIRVNSGDVLLVNANSSSLI